MLFSLRYRLRFPQKSPDRPQTLYIRLKIGPTECGDYSSGIKVKPADWDTLTRQVFLQLPHAKALNKRLADIETQHVEWQNYLVSLGKPVSAEAIKRLWTEGPIPPPTVGSAWQAHYDSLQSLHGTDMALRPNSLLKWKNGRVFLLMYVKQLHKRDDIESDRIDVAWAKKYHTWLMTYVDQTGATRKAKQSSNTARRYVTQLVAVLDTLVEAKHLPVNPLATLDIKRLKGKPIAYLTEEQIMALAGLELEHNQLIYRDLALLCCYTGLDYPDLLKLLANPGEYDKGDKLVIPRNKKGEGIAKIPVLPQTRALLDRYAGGHTQAYAPQTINKMLKVFAILIHYRLGPLKIKNLRMTCGTLFLNARYDMGDVAQILGHRSQRTTELHYAAFLDKRIERAMAQHGVDFFPVATTQP